MSTRFYRSTYQVDPHFWSELTKLQRRGNSRLVYHILD